MKRRGLRLVLLTVMLAGGTRLVSAEAIAADTGRVFGAAEDRQTLHLAQLREWQETGIFILKRYATLEALLTAKERGQTEQNAFWIGTASLIPGAGQMINEDYLQGGLLLFASSLSFGTVQQLAYTRPSRRGNDQLLPWYYAALAVRNGIMTYATLHAANASYRQDRDRTRAMWIGAASVLPGVGQAINGDWWSAIGFFTTWSLAAAATGYFEESVFTQGGPGYLVQDPEPLRLCWIPGGAALMVTTTW